jgi:SAM-dependent methyltransferase
LRAFTRGGASFRIRHLGYCPRCHAKARHRRIWLFLEQKTDLFEFPLRLLHVSPEYCFSRRLKKLSNLFYVGGDIADCPNIAIKMDLAATPLLSDSFDAVICIHILEHIEDDHRALSELYRVLKPGGWAVISVPLRWDRKTHENAKILSEEERERAFGETGHVRAYGNDFIERLEKCGFRAEVDLGKNVHQQAREKYGLRDDEDIFFCHKNTPQRGTS